MKATNCPLCLSAIDLDDCGRVQSFGVMVPVCKDRKACMRRYDNQRLWAFLRAGLAASAAVPKKGTREEP